MPWDKLNEWSKMNGGQGFIAPIQGPVPVDQLPEVEIAPDPAPSYATPPQQVKDYIIRRLQEKEKYRAPIIVHPDRIIN